MAGSTVSATSSLLDTLLRDFDKEMKHTYSRVVYRVTTDGYDVIVKDQITGLTRSVALDNYLIRELEAVELVNYLTSYLKPIKKSIVEERGKWISENYRPTPTYSFKDEYDKVIDDDYWMGKGGTSFKDLKEYAAKKKAELKERLAKEQQEKLEASKLYKDVKDYGTF